MFIVCYDNYRIGLQRDACNGLFISAIMYKMYLQQYAFFTCNLGHLYYAINTPLKDPTTSPHRKTLLDKAIIITSPH
jgi:hypothetical protein